MKKSTQNSRALLHLPTKTPAGEVPLSFGAVLQKYRKKAGMSQPELAGLMDTSRNTITNWETDKSKPSFDQTKELCDMFGIPIYELYGYSGSALPSSHENTVLHQYRRLSPLGRRIVDKMVYEMLSEELRAQDDYLRQNSFLLPFQATPAAAGPGCEFNTVPPKPMFVKKTVCSERADAVIRVSGRSMEPLYQDGDLVYIKYCDTANEEDDVVCSTADGAVIKRLRSHRLNSLNPDYPYAVKTDDDNVRIVGRVLGVVEPDDIPDEDDTRLLQDIFHDELMEFYEKYGE